MYALEDVAPNTLWYHPKTGGLYLVLGVIEDSTNGHEGTCYVGYYSFKHKVSRVRKALEFLDGRFLLVNSMDGMFAKLPGATDRGGPGSLQLLFERPSLDSGPKTFPVKPPQPITE